MAHYKALKHTIRGKAGTLIDVHGNDIKLLQRNGVIGDKPYQGKAQAAPVDPTVKLAQLEQEAQKLTAQIEALKAKRKSAAKAEAALDKVKAEMDELIAAMGAQ